MASNEPQKEPELIIEIAEEPQPAQEGEPQSAADTEPKPERKKAKKAKENINDSVIEQMKQQASEDDTPLKGQRKLRDIVGGDFLTALVRRHIWLILLTVLIVTCYIAVRYQCQQDQIDIANMEKTLNETKYKALSSTSSLTIMCRQSNLEEMLRANGDSLIHSNMQPPFRIETPEE